MVIRIKHEKKCPDIRKEQNLIYFLHFSASVISFNECPVIRLAAAICVLDQREPKYMKCAISAIIGRLKNLSRTLIGVRISLTSRIN